MSYDRLLDKFSTSLTLSQQGVWYDVDLGDGGPIPGFLCGRMGSTNIKWAEMAAQSFNETRQQRAIGALSSTESRQRAIKVFAYSILFNWRNINNEDGNPRIYTPEEGIILLTKADRLYDYLLDQVQTDSNYQEATIAEKVGNLKNT